MFREKQKAALTITETCATAAEAGEVMLERVGPDALSMRELAREVGVSNNAPRRHFASKQALLDALALQGFEQLGATLNRALADQEPDFEKRLVKLARANIRFATSHRALRRLMFTAKQRENAPAEVVEAAYKGLSAGPATIAYGQSVGAVGPGDTRLMSITVFAALEGLLSLSVDGKFGGVPLERLMQDVITTLLRGCVLNGNHRPDNRISGKWHNPLPCTLLPLYLRFTYKRGLLH